MVFYKVILKNVDPKNTIQHVEADSYDVKSLPNIGKCYVFGPNDKAHFKFDDVVGVDIVKDYQ